MRTIRLAYISFNNLTVEYSLKSLVDILLIICTFIIGFYFAINQHIIVFILPIFYKQLTIRYLSLFYIESAFNFLYGV